MLASGTHSIKVFGVDSFGLIYQSSLIVFTIDFQRPNPPDLPPDNPFINNLPILILIIIGSIVILGIAIFVILILNNMPRKIRSTPMYDTPILREERYFKESIRERLSSNTRLIQCPYCLRWDEPGGKYRGYCGEKFPENID